MQSRDDFLAGVAALVDGGCMQALQRQCRRQQLIQQLRRQPRPARAQLRQAPCIVAIAGGGDAQAVRVAAEQDRCVVIGDGVQRQRRAGRKRAWRQRGHADFRAEHETPQRIGHPAGDAAAQQQQVAVVGETGQMEQRAHAPLRIEPGTELPLAGGERADRAAELRMRESRGVRAFDQQGFGRMVCRHGSGRVGGRWRRAQVRYGSRDFAGAWRMVVLHCRKY